MYRNFMALSNDPDLRLNNFIRMTNLFWLTVTTCISTWLIFKQGSNGEIRNFFSAQAISILNGNLNVDESDLPGECYVHNKKCFGYFGITPSLLRMPFLLVNENLTLTSTSLLTGIFLGLCATLLLLKKIASMTFFWNSDNSKHEKFQYFLVATALLPGSLFLQLTRPSGQWEVIVWGSTFVLYGIFLVLCWFTSDRKRYLLLALLFFTLAANARITNGLVAFGVGAVCYKFLNDSGQKFFKPNGISNALILLVSILPTFSALGVLYLKFGSFFPNLELHQQIPETGAWAQILEINGGKTVSLIFILTNFCTYFRPDSFIFTGLVDVVSSRPTYFPVLDLYPLKSGGMYHEPSLSITNLLPIFLLMSIELLRSMDFFRLSKNKANPSVGHNIQRFLTGISLASFIGLFITLTFVASSNRYLGDFIPAATLTTAFGLFSKFKRANQSNNPIKYGWIICLILIGLTVNILSSITRARYGFL